MTADSESQLPKLPELSFAHQRQFCRPAFLTAALSDPLGHGEKCSRIPKRPQHRHGICNLIEIAIIERQNDCWTAERDRMAHPGAKIFQSNHGTTRFPKICHLRLKGRSIGYRVITENGNRALVETAPAQAVRDSQDRAFYGRLRRCEGLDSGQSGRTV